MLLGWLWMLVVGAIMVVLLVLLLVVVVVVDSVGDMPVVTK